MSVVDESGDGGDRIDVAADDAAVAAPPGQALVATESRGNLLCRLGFHRARPSSVYNDGHYFSSCQRCGITMTRRPDGEWKPLPRNLRVVWRKRTADDIVFPTHLH